MSTQSIDYEALAKQHGAIGYTPGATAAPKGKVDYAAMAKQGGAINSAPAPAPNPYQEAATRFAAAQGTTPTSISAGPPKPAAEGPSFLDRFLHAVGIPTSQGEATTTVQNALTPQAEPGAEGLLKFEEQLPVVGSDFRARADLARQGRPTSLVPFLGPAIAQFTESTVGEHPDIATGLGSGVNLAGQVAGARSIMAPKAPAAGLVESTRGPASMVAPAHVEALTGLLEDRGGTVDPHATATEALPHLREAAAREGINPAKLSGREAGQATIKVAEHAVNAAQDEFNTIRKPYNAVLVDQKPIAQAYRDAITPELLKNEPKVAAALERQAKKFDQPVPLDQVNQYRIRMNNRLDAYERGGQTDKLMSDIGTRADAAGANAARDIEYSTVGRLSGLDPEYVRALKQREGSLIEAKRSLTREYNKASGEQGEAVSQTLREKATTTFPSRHGVEKSVLKNLLGPKPIEVLNSRIRKMFEGLGEASAKPEYELQQPAAPGALPEGGPSGPVPSGEEPRGIKPPQQRTFLRTTQADVKDYYNYRFDQLREEMKGAASPEAKADVQRRMSELDQTQRTHPTSEGGTGIKPPVAPASTVQVPMMITRQMEADLRARGIPQAKIDKMSPAEAHAELNKQGVPVEGGKVAQTHVASENAFYTQARSELGANVDASTVLQRAQALKVEHAAKAAPLPVTPANPPKPPTLTRKMAARPLPTLRRVMQPVAPGVATTSPAATPAMIMLQAKRGDITPAEADRRIKQLTGGGGNRTIRRPVAPE